MVKFQEWAKLNLHSSWHEFLYRESAKRYFINILRAMKNEYSVNHCLPRKSNVFNVFKEPLSGVKVVIVGQDPYPSAQNAMGYAFASPKMTKSLDVIFKEIELEYGQKPQSTTLEPWIKQGVFLLNMHLTVRAGTPLSHEFIGWTTFTRNAIKEICNTHPEMIFMLWGSYARFNRDFILTNGGRVLDDVHPMNYHYKKEGFLGNNHFKIANSWLQSQNKQAISWV